MAQLTQFLLTKGAASMNVQPDALATYQAADWQIDGIRYSEGGEGLDTTSQVLMVKEPDRIHVRPGAVAAYRALGYQAKELIYGASGPTLSDLGGSLGFLDTPAFGSAEIGTVDAVTLAVTFSTEVAAEDFAAGVTIEVDDTPVEIASATRQADHTIVYYVIPEVAFGSDVTWAFDDDTGGIVSANDGVPLDDVAEQEVTNNVPEA